jgi:hypothetical protein
MSLWQKWLTGPPDRPAAILIVWLGSATALGLALTAAAMLLRPKHAPAPVPQPCKINQPHAALSSVHDFEIPAGLSNSTLLCWSYESGGYFDVDGPPFQTPALRGRMTSIEALRRLTANADVELELSQGDFVAIRQSTAAQP